MNSFYSQSIHLKVKRTRHNEEKLNKSIVCSKCVLPNEKDINDLKWWFYLNSKMGHDFIDVCNPLKEKSLLSQIKTEYGEFARIRHLNCFPNLSSQKNVVSPIFTTFDEFINAHNDNLSKSRYIMLRQMDLLNEIIINECYLDYFDKYRYIPFNKNRFYYILSLVHQFFISQ